MALTKNSQIDLNGNEMILDADADTSITADTDDQIDIKVAGSDNIKITASAFEIGTTAPKINLKNTDTSIIADQSLGVIEVESTDGSTGSAGTIAKLDIAASGAFDGSGHGSQYRFSTGATNQSGSIALTEQMRLSDVGNLHLSGGSDRRIQLGSGGAGANQVSNNTVHIRGDGTNMKLMAASGGSYLFEENGTVRFRIATGGNVGVGMTPTHKLSVVGVDSSSAINIGEVDSSFPDTLGMFVSSTAHTQTGYGDLNIKARTDYGGYYGIGFFTASSNSSPTLRFKIDSTGNLFYINAPGSSAGNPTLYVNTSTGYIYYYSSSLRYKENVQDFPSALAKVNQLRPVTYNDKATGEASSGLIAEEVHEITPELVTYKEIDGSLQPETVLYDRLTIHLLKAIQEQQTQIEALQSEINTLKGG